MTFALFEKRDCCGLSRQRTCRIVSLPQGQLIQDLVLVVDASWFQLNIFMEPSILFTSLYGDLISSRASIIVNSNAARGSANQCDVSPFSWRISMIVSNEISTKDNGHSGAFACMIGHIKAK
jgi:hypothetical protein